MPRFAAEDAGWSPQKLPNPGPPAVTIETIPHTLNASVNAAGAKGATYVTSAEFKGSDYDICTASEVDSMVTVGHHGTSQLYQTYPKFRPFMSASRWSTPPQSHRESRFVSPGPTS